MGGRWLIPLLLLGLAWGQELIDQLFWGGQWNLPMGPGLPLWRILTAPFSHAGFGHLISNTLVFLPLSWLVLTRGSRDYIAVWIGVLLVAIPIAMLWPASGPWALRCGVWIARLSPVNRLSGTKNRPNSSGRTHLLVVWLSLAGLDPRSLTRRCELGWSRRRISGGRSGSPRPMQRFR